MPPSSGKDSSWSKIIRSEHRLLDIDFAELWRYRDLIILMVKRDFHATYSQTILGPLWFILQPLLTSSLFTILFTQVAKISTDGIPPFLFYMSGVVAWGYFSDCFTKTATTFRANAHVFGKVYFPRLVVPIASVITCLINFAVQFGMFLLIYLVLLFKGAPLYPSFRVIVLPVLIVQMALLGIGLGCLLSSVTVRYRDLAVAIGFLTQMWMYASCVFYPLSSIPKEWHWLVVLNPMVPVIESFRFSFLGAGTVEIWQLAIGVAMSILLLFLGVMVFNHTARTFNDTV